ncbi:MAG: S1C family serine protease, partial [Pseudomonadota bacterium]|nr:S1C family serine protease [Pseudomonadota bacterium]
MPKGRVSLVPVLPWLRFLLVVALVVVASNSAAPAQTASLDQLVSSVVRIKTRIDPDGRTVGTLGREREGSGIVIDDNGLVLTIGYLMVEAWSAEISTNAGRTVPASVVGYDPETGFGLLRAIVPLNLQPMAFGRSAELKERDPVLIASFGGAGMVAPARVVSKREFAGNWEYLLDEAIFTSPPHPEWSGAALINREGKLVGVGSLIVGDATGTGDKVPGNMFVPIDRLPPILGDLVAGGRASGSGRPWLGVTTNEAQGRLVVSRVAPGSPAEGAKLQPGDVIVGVDGERPKDLADFYRKVRAEGDAGAVIPLDVLRNN